jgi:two-component system LytT family response regulator
MTTTPLLKPDFIRNGYLHILRHQKVINPSEIVMMKADINYCTIYLQNGEKIMIAKTLKIMENLLDNQVFCRIHRNILINKKHILAYDSVLGEVLMTNNHRAFTSRRRKETFDVLMRN